MRWTRNPRHGNDWGYDPNTRSLAEKVFVEEPNILAVLLGPDGNPISWLVDKSSVEIGFRSQKTKEK